MNPQKCNAKNAKKKERKEKKKKKEKKKGANSLINPHVAIK